MRWIPSVAGVVAAVIVAHTVPASWCARDAGAWFEGEADVQRALARSVIAQCGKGLSKEDFHTGSELFDGEWLFGSMLMAGIGLCQVVQAQPEMRDECVVAIEQCIDAILSAPVREFDSRSWGNDAIETLEGGRGHAAYLGYFNFLLGLYREIAPGNRFVALNDRISAALAARLKQSPNGLIETYPDEWYAVDNAPGLASLALYDRATGGDASRLDGFLSAFRKYCVDPDSGLLFQAFDSAGRAVDKPRGSGTALAVFFLGHSHPEFAAELYAAMKRELESELLGFGAIREYPRGSEGSGDIDSGPIILGFGFSATGFSIGGARLCGDRKLFSRLFASAYLAGAPIRNGDQFEFVSGGPLGNAIMLAMLTAPAGPAR